MDPLLSLTSECGANTYDNQTIAFVLNGESGCSPRITIVNSIQLNVKFSMTIK